ncbi:MULTISPECIES: hypothetical protein [unclassified Microbacterium]|uniref:hypothetical protein n=1 Tax=unclassified Microbacterium TaxID=2609290 RepID=UPI0038709A06
MSNAARKARKRAGIPFVKAAKKPTYPNWGPGPRGLDLTSGAEILASLVVRGIA